MIQSWLLVTALGIGLFAIPSRVVAADPVSTTLKQLLTDAWDFELQEAPLFATHVGDHRFNDKLGSVSLEDIQRRTNEKRGFLRRLEAISRGDLPRAEQINHEMFARSLRDDITEDEFQSYLIPISNREGFHIRFPELPKRTPLANVKDYENYIARLTAFERYTTQHIELMRAGMKKGWMLPGVVLKGYREPIEAQIVDDPAKSLLDAPFRKFPDTIAAAERERLTTTGRKAIAESVVPAYRKFLKFMESEYVPAAPGIIGASSLPMGREFYRHRVRKYTTLNLTPEQVHATGMSEVKRIRAEMQKVIEQSGFRGDFAAFLAHLRTDPKFYATTPEQLMQHVALICKRIDGQLPKLFRTLPRTPYGLREIPSYIAARTTSAYYQQPAGDGSDSGYYYLNTFNLKSRPLYEMEALSLHEAVPGHHFQLALQQELTDLPPFRRFSDCTAFIEGWGLYAERLGLEVGFYRDPYSDFGRLTFEMWRACRLVVDTGMHYLGWSRQRSIDFMAANTALSLHNIESEVDRYISWPGQALAYKIGELKIRELRQRAETKLREKFDVREFHDVVLTRGAVPLAILEENVNRYIAEKSATDVAASSREESGEKLVYPTTRRVEQVDNYHGTKIADPYRWLEDDNSSETKAWVETQNKVTFAHLDKIPHRDKLRQRLTELWNYERIGVPRQHGGRYFYDRNDGLQNQNVLLIAETLDGTPRMLLDPNTLSKDGTVALSGLSISEDGKLLAYSTSDAGSDWNEWRVRDVSTGRELPDHIRWCKFSGASWTPDGSGFYYSRYDEPPPGAKLTGANYFQKLYVHKLGTPQSQDRLIYERKDHKDWGFNGNVTDDGKYLIVSVRRGAADKNCVFYQELAKPDAPVVELLKDFDGRYGFLDNDGPVFWFQTDNGADRGRVIAIDTRKPEREHWADVIPEATDVLDNVSVVGDRFIATYMHDAHTVVKVFDLAGKFLRQVDLPGIGTAGGFRGKRTDRETFYAFTSYTTPATIYRYDVASGRSTVFRQPKVAFNPADYETKQVFYHSKDGTRVPMFLSHKKGLKLDGRHPTLLYGYGGFTNALQPGFSVTSLVWMEQGGVYAVANLRGGSEYGDAWHRAGMLDKKQNVFEDFIAAAEWLIANKYTSRERLAIQGGSNGGLLVGACMTQRPELFGVCLPAVGVMDMLRYHKFTIGWAWAAEYGSSDDPGQFKTLLAYSPLHNLKPGTKYPATLITTADHDDRVVPAHSFKFAAALQAAQAGPAPTLIRIETRAGHGAGKPTKKRIEEAADVLGFTLFHLGMK